MRFAAKLVDWFAFPYTLYLLVQKPGVSGGTRLKAVTEKVIPELNISELRQKARTDTKRILFWTLLTFAVLILTGLSALGLLIYLAVRLW
jgi:hypothetical protein